MTLTYKEVVTDLRARCVQRRVGLTPAGAEELLEYTKQLEAVAEAARAFVAMTSVFRQRRDCRPEFEALCIALLEERRVDALVAAGATGKVGT